MTTKINVYLIDSTWDTCTYKWRVFVNHNFSQRDDVLNTLRKWFGEVEYFANNCFLASSK